MLFPNCPYSIFEVRKAICTSKTLWSRVEIYEMCSGSGFQSGGPDLCCNVLLPACKGFSQTTHTHKMHENGNLYNQLYVYIVCGPSVRAIFL